MAPGRPIDEAGLEALADELERWSTFAYGAIDDLAVRHRQVRERVRRAERALALAQDTVSTDVELVASQTAILDRLREESARLTTDAAARHRGIEGLLAGAGRISLVVQAAIRENLVLQHEAATRLSTAVRDDQRARAGLHRSLDVSRRQQSRAFGRRSEPVVALALELAEDGAHRTAQALQQSREELIRLRGRHEELTTALAEVDVLVHAAAGQLEDLESGRQEAVGGTERLTAAMNAHARATAAQERVRALAGAMQEHTGSAVADLGAADAVERDAGRSYEAAQRLTSEVVRGLRDRMASWGDARRAGHTVDGRHV